MVACLCGGCVVCRGAMHCVVCVRVGCCVVVRVLVCAWWVCGVGRPIYAHNK